MRGSAAFRTSVAPGGALAPGWVKNELWRKARTVPSLDLRFADDKSLVDATTGASLVTFTRASSGTFVGSDGVLRTAVTNLVLRSEEFDNASWTKVRASISANTITAPNGTLTADTGIEDTSSSTTHNPLIQDATIVANGTYTASLYVRAKERSRGVIDFSSTDSANFARGDFNLSTGTITASNAGTGSGASASISNVGGGWFRVSITGSIGSSLTTGRFVLRMADASGNIAYTGDGTSGIYLWGAQLEQSSTVGEYIPTTSVINSAPRFDHNPTTGESLGLLVEEARTNLITTSEALANVTGASITNNTTTAPDGLITADTLTEDTSTGSHSVNTASIIWVGNTSYTFTIFLKANTRSQVNIAFGTSSNWVNSQRSAVFDLSTGTVASSPGTPVVASIEAYLNGWYRCRLTATTVAVPLPSTTQIQMYTAGSSSYTGNGTSGLFFWGAQLEAAAFPTSYIPTTTAAATRSADVASVTGTAFSNWYRQDEGTVFAESQISGASNETGIAGLTNAGETDFLRVSRLQTTLRPRSLVFDNSVVQADTQPTNTITIGQAFKLATVLKQNDFSTVLNGGSAAVDTSGTMPTVDRMTIGTGAFLTQLNGTIKRLTYWPVRLPDATLQSITQ